MSIIAEATRSDGLHISIETGYQAATNADIATREPGGPIWKVRVTPARSSMYYLTTHYSEAEARAYANREWRTQRFVKESVR